MPGQRLLGKVAIVTGSSSGMGRAIALTYFSEGAIVVCADLIPHSNSPEKDGEKPTHEEILSHGGKSSFLKTDVLLEQEVQAVVAFAAATYGRLDIMVNNAGITHEVASLAATPGGVPLHLTATNSFDLVMGVNVRGVYLGCKYALAQFLSQEPHPPNSRGDRTKGWIVNIASIAGLVVFSGAPAYTASKFAVIGLTKEMAVTYAKERIHCNAVCPSFVPTGLTRVVLENEENPISVGTTAAITAAHPWGALGTREDVARGAVFLASEDAQWITGSTLVIDGGYTAQ